MTSDSPTDETGVEPPETFAALADPTRLRAVRTVAESDEPPTFTELFEASDADTTAGFAYHLRQLTGRYLRKADERYHLTYAGRRLARALDAGTFTDRVDRDPEAVEGRCPICGESELAAGVADSVVAIACGACETELLALPFTPNGVADRPTEEVLRAFDSYHRARLSMVADGVCPDCAGAAASRIELRDHPAVPDDSRPVADCGCADCGFRLRVPVSLLLLDHPAVRRFAADTGIDLDDRPIWNLGPEWAERVVSEDPPAVAVSLTTGGERVELLVGDGPTVPRVRRESLDEGADGPDEELDEPTDDPTDELDEPADDPTDELDEPADDPTDELDEPRPSDSEPAAGESSEAEVTAEQTADASTAE